MFNAWARAMREVYMLYAPDPYRSALMARAWPHLLDAAKKASGSREEVVQSIQEHLARAVRTDNDANGGLEPGPLP